MAKPIYQTQKLLENPDFSFDDIDPERQSYLKKQKGYDFSLKDVAELIREQTDNYTKEIPEAIDLDNSIFQLVIKYKEQKGEKPEFESEPEQTPDDVNDEAKELIQTIKDLSELLEDKDSYSESEINEWTEAVNDLKDLLKDKNINVDDKGDIKYAKGGCILK